MNDETEKTSNDDKASSSEVHAIDCDMDEDCTCGANG